MEALEAAAATSRTKSRGRPLSARLKHQVSQAETENFLLFSKSGRKALASLLLTKSSDGENGGSVAVVDYKEKIKICADLVHDALLGRRVRLWRYEVEEEEKAVNQAIAQLRKSAFFRRLIRFTVVVQMALVLGEPDSSTLPGIARWGPTWLVFADTHCTLKENRRPKRTWTLSHLLFCIHPSLPCSLAPSPLPSLPPSLLPFSLPLSLSLSLRLRPYALIEAFCILLFMINSGLQFSLHVKKKVCVGYVALLVKLRILDLTSSTAPTAL